MEYKYLTIGQKARAEHVIEKSRFIATVCPVQTRDEAEAFFSEIRAEFKDATHNVPVMVIGDKMQLQWASDDGEPQGTSGPPILKMIVNKGITNIAMVVTRYFGGIKLGTGGLVRAYTQSAELAIKESGLAYAVPYIKARVSTDYANYNKILNYRFPENLKSDISLSDAEFGENVEFTLSTTAEISKDVKGILVEITNGSINFFDEEETLGLRFLDNEESL